MVACMDQGRRIDEQRLSSKLGTTRISGPSRVGSERCIDKTIPRRCWRSRGKNHECGVSIQSIHKLEMKGGRGVTRRRAATNRGSDRGGAVAI